MVYDWETGLIRQADLERDRLIYYNVSNLETFQFGFGQLCSVPDWLVRQINLVIRKQRDEIPLPFKRLKKNIFKKYYPDYYYGNYTPFSYSFVQNIDYNRRCEPIRRVLNYSESANGLRQLHEYKYSLGYDVSPIYSNDEN